MGRVGRVGAPTRGRPGEAGAPWRRCAISSNEVRRGGFGPIVRTPSRIFGSAYLSPVVAITLFDEKLMVYIQVPVYEGCV